MLKLYSYNMIKKINHFNQTKTVYLFYFFVDSLIIRSVDIVINREGILLSSILLIKVLKISAPKNCLFNEKVVRVGERE